MIWAILYFENSDIVMFDVLKESVKNNYVLNKEEYPMTVTIVQRLLLNYELNYNSDGKFQSQGFRNQCMLAQSGENGDDEGEKNSINKPREETLITSPAMIVEKIFTMQ